MKVPLDILTEEDIPGVLDCILEQEKPLSIVLLRYSDFRRARRDKSILKHLKEASLVLPVNKSLASGMKFLGLPETLRVHPFFLLIRMLGHLEAKSKSLYVVGGSHKEIQAAAGNLRTSFPKINLVGRHRGFYRTEDQSGLITAIKKAGPSILFLGTGIPGKLKWILEQQENLGSNILYHAPEAFQVIVGKRRPPDRQKFQKGEGSFWKALLNPLGWWKAFSYLGYWTLLLVYRLRKNK